MQSRTASLMLVAACLSLMATESVRGQTVPSENPPSAYAPRTSWSMEPPTPTASDPQYARPAPATIENHTLHEPRYPQTSVPQSPPPPSAPSQSDSHPLRELATEHHLDDQVQPAVSHLPVMDTTPEPMQRSPAPVAIQQPPPAPAASGPSVPLAPRAKAASRELKADPPTTLETFVSVGGSLAVVLGIFLVVVWFSRRYMPQASTPLPKDAVEMLGWAPLAGRQQMQLVRIGNKLVLLAVTNGGVETLTEVTDLLEVERLSALCRRAKPGSSSASFRQTLTEFEREPAPGGFVGTQPAAATSSASPRPGRIVGRLGAVAILTLTLALASPAVAQQSASSSVDSASPGTLRSEQSSTGAPENLTLPTMPLPFDALSAEGIPSGGNPLNEILSGGPEEWASPKRLSSTLQIMLLLTVLSLAPAILLMTTSFVRIIVVLGLLRQALGTQQLPPSQVMTALAMFMTLLVMTPTWREVYNEGIEPYSSGHVTNPEDAWNRSVVPIKRFLSRQIEMAGNSDDVWLFYDYLPEAQTGAEPPATYDDVPLQALLPAFMLSELKTAFLIGFQIYLPFLILDIVVSSITISMGMMMLPPVMISLPLKLLLFVLVDGWNLVVGMLLQSFGAPL